MQSPPQYDIDARPLLLEYENWRGHSFLTLTPWARALLVFAACKAEMETDNSSFIERLTSSQRFALVILVDWWDARYDYSFSIDETKEFIKEDLASKLGSLPSSLVELLGSLLTKRHETSTSHLDSWCRPDILLSALDAAMEIEEHGLEKSASKESSSEETDLANSDTEESESDETESRSGSEIFNNFILHNKFANKFTNESGESCYGVYHTSLTRLFGDEFMNFISDLEAASARELSASRRTAGEHAACRRVVWSVSQPGEDLNPVSEAESRFKQPTPAMIDPCPWITKHSLDGVPFYLWDAEKKETVKTENIPVLPLRYTVISHTWGRWRMRGQDSEVQIEGVPWMIPRNTRFDVESLPNEFLSLCQRKGGNGWLQTRYIWFDLFCIPQDRSKNEFRKRAQEEIQKQAAIFRRAYQAAAWFNQVPDWRGLRCAIQWFAAQHLKTTEFRSRDESLASVMSKRISSIMTEMSQEGLSTFLCHDYDLPQREEPNGPWASTVTWLNEPCGWFTSLWTLQEFFLRPDMVFLDGGLNICTLHDHGSSPVTVDIMTTLSMNLDKTVDLVTLDLPKPVQEIMVATTSFFKTESASRLGLLVAAQERQCRGSRAEAVSAVLNATRWMESADYPPVEAPTLVLDMYPIEFLREVRRGSGGAFFCSRYFDETCYWDTFKGLGGPSVRMAGTMLPFDRHGQDRKRAPSHSMIMEGHPLPQVESWSLGDDGRVLASDVALVATTDPTYMEGLNSNLHALVKVITQDDRWHLQPEVRLNLVEFLISLDWIKGHKYAVLLAQDQHIFSPALSKGSGAILVELPDEDQKERRFAKLLNFRVWREPGLCSRVWSGVNWELW